MSNSRMRKIERQQELNIDRQLQRKLQQDKFKRAKRRYARDRAVGTMAEFGPALTIFFLVILFPLINLIGLAIGYGTLFFATSQAALTAGGATTYYEALSSAEAKTQQITNSGLGSFAKLQPVDGVNGSGMDLFVIETPTNAPVSTAYGPNGPMNTPVDTDNNTYEYETVLTFDVGPFMNMGMLPFVGEIPGIGSPVRLSCASQRFVESPNGLTIDNVEGGGGPPSDEGPRSGGPDQDPQSGGGTESTI